MAARHLQSFLIPLAALAFTLRDGRLLPVLGVLLVAGLSLVVLEWHRFTYRVVDGQLVIERGVLQRATRILPLDRIRGVDVTAPLLHRCFGLVRVEIEAAAGGGAKAELTLPAVRPQAAEELRRRVVLERSSDGLDQAPPIVYRATPGLLVAGGLTSWTYLLAPVAALGVVSNLVDDLPGGLDERLRGEAATLAPETLAAGLLTAAGVLALAAALAALGSLLVDGGFTLVDEGERLVAQRGLLTRRVVTLDRTRVRGYDVRDGVLRRPFGLCAVRAVVAGIGARGRGRTTLAPVIERRRAGRLLSRLDQAGPGPSDELERHPRAARSRRIVRAVIVPLVAALGLGVAGYPWPAGVAVMLVAGGVWLGVDRYRQLGHRVAPTRVVIREGSVSRRWTVFDPDAIVAYELRRSPFQARVGLCTVVLHLGDGAGSRRLLDVSEAQARSALASISPRVLAPLIGGAGGPSALGMPDRALERETTVDQQLVPGDVAGSVRGEEDRGVGDLRG